MWGKCEWCGRAESVRPGRKYCSQTCFGMARRTPLRACLSCGSLFPPRRREQRFCSRTCRGASDRQQSTKACENCGEAFTVTPASADRQFCSLRCKGEASRIERSGPRPCIVCGTTLVRKHGPHRLESNRQFEQRRTCSAECGRILAGVGRMRPWHVATRTLLARSCRDCGRLLPGDAFPRSGDGVPSHCCYQCSYGHRTDEQRSAQLAAGREWFDRLQRESRSTATRHGYQWTGAELEIALREDLTRAELAMMLGRTVAAVSGARQKARREPKWIAVVGAARP